MVTRNLKEGLKGKLRMYLDKVSLVVRRGKGTGDAIQMPRVTSK